MEPNSTLKVAEQAAKELGITQLVPAIYQDLLQPAAREAGQQFVVVARAVGIALAPLHASVWGFDQIKDYLSAQVARSLANKPAAEIKSPDLVVAGPAMLNMRFAADAPHLREMYANLLATAMHGPSAEKAHPSFVQIIQQLSSAEAQILKGIARDYKSGSVLFREHLANLERTSEKDPGYGIFGWGGFGSSNISHEWQALCAKCGIARPALANAFYRNLVRLGILAERIEEFGEESPFSFLGSKAVSQRKLSSYVELTEYGDLFLDVCVRDS
jgi:hypothetical protein